MEVQRTENEGKRAWSPKKTFDGCQLKKERLDMPPPIATRAAFHTPRGANSRPLKPRPGWTSANPVDTVKKLNKFITANTHMNAAGTTESE